MPGALFQALAIFVAASLGLGEPLPVATGMTLCRINYEERNVSIQYRRYPQGCVKQGCLKVEIETAA